MAATNVTGVSSIRIVPFLPVQGPTKKEPAGPVIPPAPEKAEIAVDGRNYQLEKKTDPNTNDDLYTVTIKSAEKTEKIEFKLSDLAAEEDKKLIDESKFKTMIMGKGLSEVEYNLVRSLVLMAGYNAQIEALEKAVHGDKKGNSRQYLQLADNYKNRAYLQVEKSKSDEDFNQALKVLKELTGEKPDFKNVAKKQGKDNDKTVRRIFELAMVSLGEAYLALGQWAKAEEVLPEVDKPVVGRQVKDKAGVEISVVYKDYINSLVDMYFSIDEAKDFIARAYQARADAYKGAGNFTEAEKLLNSARAYISESLPKVKDKKIQKKLSGQLKTIQVSLVETYLGQKNLVAATTNLESMITFSYGLNRTNIQSAFAQVGKSVRDDLIQRTSHATADTLKIKALEVESKPEKKQLLTPAVSILKDLQPTVRTNTPEFFRVNVGLAEAYQDMGQVDAARQLLATRSEEQTNGIPLLSFSALTGSAQTNYFIRANLVLADSLNGERKSAQATNLVNFVAANINMAAVAPEVQRDFTERKANIELYARYSQIGDRLMAIPAHESEINETDAEKKAQAVAKALIDLKEVREDFKALTDSVAGKIKPGSAKDLDFKRLAAWVTLKTFDVVKNFEIRVESSSDTEVINSLYSGRYTSTIFNEVVSLPPDDFEPQGDKPLDSELYEILRVMNVVIPTLPQDAAEKRLGEIEELAGKLISEENLKAILDRKEWSEMVGDKTYFRVKLNDEWKYEVFKGDVVSRKEEPVEVISNPAEISSKAKIAISKDEAEAIRRAVKMIPDVQPKDLKALVLEYQSKFRKILKTIDDMKKVETPEKVERFAE